MKRNILILVSMSIITVISCKSKVKDNSENQKNNPFFSEYTTPFQVPPFDKIDTSHYMPAFIEGMKQEKSEIEAIVNNTEAPTFDNTILAYDKSGRFLTKVRSVFYNINSCNTNDQIDKIARDIAPLLSQHKDEISMNAQLFERIKSVYDKRQNSNLDSLQIRVVTKYYQDFVRRGANLPKEKQEELKKVNSELATLILDFREKLLAETNKNFKLVIEDKKDLDGLPQSVIDGAAETAKEFKMDGKWVFTIQTSSIWAFMQYSTKRDLREKLYRAYTMKGNNGNEFDTKETIAKIFKLRVQKAKLLGFNSFAEYVIDENMAKTPKNVDEFLMKIWNPALNMAKNEVKEMQKIIDREGGKFKLQAWDWWYYSEKLRKEKYNLDDNELKPYFELTKVRDGMFGVANKLYDITFTKLTNVPVYYDGVEVYEAKEADGKHIGLLYLDYYPRASKGSGAWCTSFQDAGWYNGKKVDPIVSVCYNLTKPTANTPSLLNFDEVTTMFHEFGHALHALFSEGKYTRITGVVPQDYVELPSQVMENWSCDPVVLKSYAKHYKTGEVIPDVLIAKIDKSGLFNQGFVTVEYVAAALLDMAYHNLTEVKDIDILAFEKEQMDKIGLITEIAPRYRTTYFNHSVSGEYSAGYYVYLWAAVLDADAFNAFKESGDVYNKELASKFRKYCLQDCGNDEGMVQYEKFRGKQPSIDPLLKRRGLK
ncbi:MAG: peptidase M3 [Bacteroidetes bacterium CG2_30_32_10]|nr:MAG: peptidase M3 [Bacteroidetes bacterium CG2_30_32_10]